MRKFGLPADRMAFWRRCDYDMSHPPIGVSSPKTQYHLPSLRAKTATFLMAKSTISSPPMEAIWYFTRYVRMAASRVTDWTLMSRQVEVGDSVAANKLQAIVPAVTRAIAVDAGEIDGDQFLEGVRISSL